MEMLFLNTALVLNAVVCSRVRELQEALSAGMIALAISSRNSLVAALQKCWDRLRAGLDLMLDQRGADGRPARWRQRIAGARLQEGSRPAGDADRPGVVSLVAEFGGHDLQAAEESGQWKTHST